MTPMENRVMNIEFQFLNRARLDSVLNAIGSYVSAGDWRSAFKWQRDLLREARRMMSYLQDDNSWQDFLAHSELLGKCLGVRDADGCMATLENLRRAHNSAVRPRPEKTE